MAGIAASGAAAGGADFSDRKHPASAAGSIKQSGARRPAPTHEKAMRQWYRTRAVFGDVASALQCGTNWIDRPSGSTMMAPGSNPIVSASA
ncbi:MAG TPA: hypothetical protein VNS31_04690, partial [Ramlibacter sp.]|nr:hypothetical protein [Ramlibacter sp.]